MRKFLLCFVLLLFVTPSFGQCIDCGDLTDDSSWPFVSVLTSDSWESNPEERALVADWKAARETSPGIHWRHYTKSDPIYVQNLQTKVSTLPCVIVQEPSGKVQERAYGSLGRLLLRRGGGCIKKVLPDTPPEIVPPPVAPQNVIVQYPPIAPVEPKDDISWFAVVLAGLVGMFIFYKMEGE